MANSKSPRIAGVILGIWLSWLYAFIFNEANRVNLPGIALPDPPGGVVGYYLMAIIVGAVIGLLCTWPQQLWLGTLAGSAAGALLAFIAPWKPASISASQIAPSLDLVFNQFFPLTLALAPFTLLTCLSARQLSSNAAGIERVLRIFLPLLTTGLVVLAAVMALYPPETRAAFITTQKLVDDGLRARGGGQVPPPIQDVQGFTPNATGRYTLELSYELDRFQGPQLTVGQTTTNFLIVARFKNGFTLACIFAPRVTPPPCANFR